MGSSTSLEQSGVGDHGSSRVVEFVVATYGDAAAADGDFEALRATYAREGSPDEFDAATIGWKSSGEALIHRLHEQAGATDPSRGWSLAGGLAVALFPSVAVNDQLGGSGVGGKLSAVAGEVARSLTRADILALGKHLDGAGAGLVAAFDPRLAAAVADSLSGSGTSMNRSALVDIESVERVITNVQRISTRTRPKI